MRVIAGEVKGFRLRMPPKGTGTRPTSDKVREAIFGVLGARVEGARVLDLYAGTGAMAIEALSRGAGHADLVEARPVACRVIKANLVATGLTPRARVLCRPVERAMDRLTGHYRIVFLDPPYDHRDVGAILERLSTGDLLDFRADVVLEHSSRWMPDPNYGRLFRGVTKRYGDSSVSYFSAEVGA